MVAPAPASAPACLPEHEGIGLRSTDGVGGDLRARRRLVVKELYIKEHVGGRLSVVWPFFACGGSA